MFPGDGEVQLSLEGRAHHKIVPLDPHIFLDYLREMSDPLSQDTTAFSLLQMEGVSLFGGVILVRLVSVPPCNSLC